MALTTIGNYLIYIFTGLLLSFLKECKFHKKGFLVSVVHCYIHGVVAWCSCYRLFPFDLAYWSPNPQCPGIWRGGLWELIRFKWGNEGKSLKPMVVLYKKRHQRACFLFLPPLCEDTVRRCPSASQKRIPYWGSESSSTSILDFPTSRICVRY